MQRCCITCIMNLIERAKELVSHTGDRATTNRVRTLSVLLAAKQALTHREISDQLGAKKQLDRVTLYRILEWMHRKSLVHKIAGDDRVWRFRVNTEIRTHQHAHFKCTRCAKVICLKDSKFNPAPLLPLGYFLQEMELTLKGLCSECI